MSEPRTEAGRDLLDWFDTLETVAVEWAPAHSAPFVSRDIVWSVLRGNIPAIEAEAARSAAGPDVAALREKVEALRQWWAFDDTPLVSREAVLALLATPSAPSDHGACTNCHHAYAEHTGRSLRPYTMPRLPSGLGPPELRAGECCEHLEDALHTCPCPRFFAAAPSVPPAETRP